MPLGGQKRNIRIQCDLAGKDVYKCTVVQIDPESGKVIKKLAEVQVKVDPITREISLSPQFTITTDASNISEAIKKGVEDLRPLIELIKENIRTKLPELEEHEEHEIFGSRRKGTRES